MLSHDSPVLDVVDLRIERSDGRDIVSEVSFRVGAGETLAIVGESGCGKTSTALALLGHARPGTRITTGSVLLDGKDILRLDPSEKRCVRGARISYVPQDPSSSLNPRHRVGRQIEEALAVHGIARRELAIVTADLLQRVGLPNDARFQRRYPFQLSGGQQQRVAIAMALACKPLAIVLDEPTTGLDVTTQARILELLGELGAATKTAFVYVTHDLAVVDRIATRVVVMYAGRIVEWGPSERVLHRSAHPYTAMLVASVPRLRSRSALTGIAGTAPAPSTRPAGCFFAPRCPVRTAICETAFPPESVVGTDHGTRCWHAATPALEQRVVRNPGSVPASAQSPILEVAHLVAAYGSGRSRQAVVHDTSFSVSAGECLAIVGESGSGKSTIGRCIAGLHQPDAGQILLRGQPLSPRAADRRKADLKAVQIIFQNPERSLNPHETVATAITRPIRHFGAVSRSQALLMAARLLDRVRLPAAALHRYPRELSGGEKQRIAIARALAAEPALLVCDEITSSLDVSTQAAIVQLLEELRSSGLTLLFITHNLALVHAVADRVLVLKAGQIREVGGVAQVINTPANDYTRQLIAAAPELGSGPKIDQVEHAHPVLGLHGPAQSGPLVVKTGEIS